MVGGVIRFVAHPLVRRPVALVMAALYLLATIGVLPSPRMLVQLLGSVSSERYPCESCGCGCASAHECWTACCCHTTHERLKWALSQGVTPPTYVEFSDDEWIAAANALRPGSAHCSLCVTQIKQRLAQGVAMQSDERCEKASSCCANDTNMTCVAESNDSSVSCCTSAKPTWFGPAFTHAKCKAQSSLLATPVPPALPASRLIVTPTECDIVVVQVRPAIDVLLSRTLDCPTPPPRVI